MAALAPAAMSGAQAAALGELLEGRRDSASGPFGVLLRTPELMTHLQRAGAHLRFDSAVAGALLEMTVLIVARRWDQAVEWAIHEPLARQAGLSPDVIDALAQGLRPELPTADLAAAWQVVDEITGGGSVADATYAGAVEELGETALVELLVAAGYYSLLAMVMNACRTAPPAGPVLP
jgi:4-carboxymuconolactone decarboxylase